MKAEAHPATISLTNGSEIFVLLGLPAAITAAAMAAEHTRLRRQVSAPVMITIAVALLSSLRILPTIGLPGARPTARRDLLRRLTSCGEELWDTMGRFAA